MEKFVDNFYKRNRGQIKKYFDYIKENDWSEPEESIKKRGDKHYTSIKNVIDNRVIVIKGRQPEYAIQNKLVETVIERLEHFVSKVDSDITKPYVKKPLEMMTELINYHLDRIDGYLSLDIDMKSSESSTVEGEEYLNEEIDFDNILYKSHSKIYDKMSSIDLGTNKDRTEGIEFFGGDDKTAKAPLSMLNEIMREYPEVREKLNSMGIDFKSKPKNEMLIHIPEEKIPYWDEDKHFFNQSKEAIQFFLDEFKKAELGIEVDGVKISPWLYCHINLFKASIPQPHYNEFTGRLEPKDVIMNPPLRDNEYFMIQETYYEADDEMVFFCATRRAAKTTNIASHIFHSLVIGKRNGSIVGGSSSDLGHIKTDIKLCLENVHPAFRIHVINNWDDPIVRIGIKKKNQKDILKAEIKITNLSVGSGDANTKLAGFTPDFFVFDEIMKMDFEKPLAAAKASFDSVYGKRLTPILSGTGSINDDISEDTVKLLADPEKGGVKAMDWDALERNIPSDCITWKRRKFGTFIPGQMSVKVGMVKNEMPLWEYLKIEKTEKLDKIKILVTDWRTGKEIIERDRKNLAFNKDKLIQEKVDYPIDPEEIFLSGKTNPFMPETLRAYRNSLIESGDHGLNVILDYDKDGNVVYEESDKEIAPFPYQGGFHDAPVTIYQPPVYNPPFEFYIAGCLIEGEKVLTGEGMKRVEEVTLKDTLINKEGEEVKIKALQEHIKIEDVYEFEVGNTYRKTTFTKEHPIYVCRHDYYETGKSKGRVKRHNYDKFEFKRADEVREGDWIKYPNIYKKNIKRDIKHMWKEGGTRVDMLIENPLHKEDFWNFIGTYLGDGYIQHYNNSIGACFNSKEVLHIENYKRIVREVFNREPYTRVRHEGGTMVEITFNSIQLSKFILENFGERSNGKYISEWVKRIDPKYKKEIVCGYLNSDGSMYNMPNGYVVSKFTSTSKKLLEDVQDILFSLDIVTSMVVLREEGETIFPNGVTSKTKKTYSLNMGQNSAIKMYNKFREGYSMKEPNIQREVRRKRKGSSCFLSDDGEYIYFRVKKIKKKPYSGWVYNFECETNTFLTRHIATHNCDDYNQEQSDGDSVGSVVIIRRDTKEVVASLHTRPDPHSHFHRQMYMLLQLYNCPIYMENADMAFKQYTDNLGWQVSDRYLLKNVNIIGDMEKESSGNRPIGWTPTAANKSYYLGLAINSIKTQDRHETEEGNIITELGYKKIKDLRLLEEMATFRFGGNFDGITAYMSAVAYDYYLTYTMGAPEAPPTEEELRIREEERKRSIENSKRRRGGGTMFPETRGSMFPTSRGGLFPKN